MKKEVKILVFIVTISVIVFLVTVTGSFSNEVGAGITLVIGAIIIINVYKKLFGKNLF